MKIWPSILIGLTLGLGASAPASAADLGDWSMKDGPQSMPMQARWYLRGDLGYAVHSDPNLTADGGFEGTDSSIDDTWTVGGGIGLYLSSNLRGDITVDYRNDATVEGTFDDLPAGFETHGVADLSSTVVLANLYYDIDLRSRFTPYIGLGLGVAHNKTTAGSVSDDCACGFTGVTIAGASKWSVAGALMGGFSVAMRDRLHLDAGYRYLYLGEAHTGLITGTDAAALPATAGDPVVKDLWAHEFRVGLRYDIR